MTLRDMQLQELNFRLNQNPLQTTESKTQPAAAEKKKPAASEAFRPGDTFGIDADGTLRPLRLSESAPGATAEDETALRVFESLMGNKEAAKLAVRGRGV